MSGAVSGSGSSDWEPPLPEDLQQMLPQYEITGIIGRGGMGAVYRGRQARLDRDVAIKLLPETFLQGDDELNFVARFEQEARAMAKLDHPAIVSVHDFGEANEGQLYFVMEFIDGMDIHQYLKENGGHLPQESALAIVAHMLDALEYAHDHGIVHRDIKPANILLNHEGRVKIADFGLAKSLSTGDGEDDRPALTMTDVAVGTPDFVAPEALDSDQTPDHRADIYATGVMLYQMLTGILPRGQFKMPSEHRPDLDPRLDEIVSRSLQAHPDDRYASASEVRLALDRIFTTPLTRVEGAERKATEDIPVATLVDDDSARKPAGKLRPKKPEPTKMPLYLGIGLAALLLIGGLAMFLKKTSGEPEITGDPETESPAVTASSDKTVSEPAPKTAAPPKQPATSVAQTAQQPPESNDWPTGPNWRSEGGFRAWSSEPNDPLLDLGRLEGIDDVKQIYLHYDGWIVLRNNGETISHDGLANRREIRKIGYGLGAGFGLISDSGTVEQVIYNNGDYISKPLKDFRDVKELFAHTDYAAAILEDGSLQVDGLAFDGIDAKNNGEWAVKPSLAPGQRATALSGNAHGLAVRLADGSLKVWTRESGLIDLPADPKRTTLRDFVLTGVFLTGISEGSGLAMSFNWERKETGIAADGLAEAVYPMTNGWFVLHKDGGLTVRSNLLQKCPEASGPISKIHTASGDRVYLNLREKSTGPSRILWFDDRSTSSAETVEPTGLTSSEPTEPTKPSSAEKPASSPASAPPPTTPPPAGPPIPDLPGFETRLTNFHKARRQQIDALVSGYRAALNRKKEEAIAAGQLSGVEQADLSLAAFEPLAAAIEPALANEGVQPLPETRVTEGLSDDLRDLESTFRQTLAATETDLQSKLDQSLQFLESELTRNDQIKEAREVRNYRDALAVYLADPDSRKMAASSSPGGAGSSATATVTKEKPFENSLGMKFVPVPITGGPTDGQRVLFSIWETRVKDYTAFIEANPGREWPKPDFEQRDDHPAVNVSWHDAVAFCEWLTEVDRKKGIIGADEHYRLPTDHEWSCAFGIGKDEDPDADPVTKKGALADVYLWGTQWPPPPSVGNYCGAEILKNPLGDRLGEPIEGFEDPFDRTAPVGSFPANGSGIFDLGGNVWEWCQDPYIAGTNERRVLRGGSWKFSRMDYLLASARYSPVNPDVREHDGFRCVVTKIRGEFTEKGIGIRPTEKLAASPASATKEKPFVNSLAMRFVPVPITGGPTDGQRVLFSIWETRVKDYAAFIEANPGREWPKPDFERGDDHPAVVGKFVDAVDFCDWLTKEERKAGRIGADQVYRLPTDHEWSCAAGIGSREDPAVAPVGKSLMIDGFSWGTDFPPAEGAGNFYGQEAKKNPFGKGGNPIAGYDDGFDRTAPVGSFRVDSLGLYDVSGNVWEWCLPGESSKTGAPVLRGGSWNIYNPGPLNLSWRGRYLESDAGATMSARYTYGCGFRCVLASVVGGIPDPASVSPPASGSSATASATKEKPFENSLGMKFVPVPITGGPSDGQRVLFSIWETRVRDYAAFIEANPEHRGIGVAFPQSDDHPALKISWGNAVAFCEWLTEEDRRKGVIGNDETYRLPTDHEWSCAVGIGTEENPNATPAGKDAKIANAYPWGSLWPPPEGSGNFFGNEAKQNPPPRSKDEPIEGYDDGFDRTSPAGSFKRNELGLFDLAGNAAEWTNDWYSEERQKRTRRGSGWASASAKDLNASDRFVSFQINSDQPGSQMTGFRCVLSTVSHNSLEPSSPSGSAANPASATEEQPFENSLGMRFVPVPITGGPTGGQRVLFSVWETRVQDYAAFIEANPGRVWKTPDFDQGDDHPVVLVSWEDAVAFCDWLTEEDRILGNIGSGDRYRLPSDHEWSCAVGIGNEEDPDLEPEAKNTNIADVYPWGRDWPPPEGAGNYWGEETKLHPASDERRPIPGFDDGFDWTAPVASFSANNYGLYDLGGNVWEWCRDWFSSAEEERTIRGASWGNFRRGFLLSSCHGGRAPVTRITPYGFRCVLAR